MADLVNITISHLGQDKEFVFNSDEITFPDLQRRIVQTFQLFPGVQFVLIDRKTQGIITRDSLRFIHELNTLWDLKLLAPPRHDGRNAPPLRIYASGAMEFSTRKQDQDQIDQTRNTNTTNSANKDDTVMKQQPPSTHDLPPTADETPSRMLPKHDTTKKRVFASVDAYHFYSLCQKSKIIVLKCGTSGYGFTLFHKSFELPPRQPPNDIVIMPQSRSPKGDQNIVTLEPETTILINMVVPTGPAHLAGVRTGDCVVSVNGESIAGKTYQQISNVIQGSTQRLYLEIVPKDDYLMWITAPEADHYDEALVRNQSIGKYHNSTSSIRKSSLPNKFPSTQTAEVSNQPTHTSTSQTTVGKTVSMHHMNSSPSLLTTELAAPVAPPRRNSSTSRMPNVRSLPVQVNDESATANIDESVNFRPISRPAASSQPQTYRATNATKNNNYNNDVITTSDNSNRLRQANAYTEKEDKPIQRSNILTENPYGVEERMRRKSMASEYENSKFSSPYDITKPKAIPIRTSSLTKNPDQQDLSSQSIDSENHVNIGRKDSNPILSRSFSDNHETDKINKFSSMPTTPNYPSVTFPVPSNNTSLQLQIPDGTRRQSDSASTSDSGVNMKPPIADYDKDDDLDSNITPRQLQRTISSPDELELDSSTDGSDEEDIDDARSETKIDGQASSNMNVKNISNAIIESLSATLELQKQGELKYKMIKNVSNQKQINFGGKWTRVKAALRGHILFLSKERKDKTEMISVKSSIADFAYDKRKKNVFHLIAYNRVEYLFQANDGDDARSWIDIIKKSCNPDEDPIGVNVELILNKLQENPGGRKAMNVFSDVLYSFKNKKSKNKSDKNSKLKDQSSIDQDSSKFGIKIESCDMSKDHPEVPLVVVQSVRIVEARGLEMVGIYRVSGNNAAMNHVIKEFDKGNMDDIDYNDDQFADVHVFTSLLKTFFRKLPEPIITIKLYDSFLSAGRQKHLKRQMVEIKRLLYKLPSINFQTLKYVIKHLTKVNENSAINKMASSNLAIILGPTLLHGSVETNPFDFMNNMAEYYKVVELLILHYRWFFIEPFVEGKEPFESSNAKATSSEKLQERNHINDQSDSYTIDYKKSSKEVSIDDIIREREVKQKPTQLALSLNQADNSTASEDFIRRNESPRTPIRRGHALSISDNNMRGRSQSVPNKSVSSSPLKGMSPVKAGNDDEKLFKEPEPPLVPRRQSNVDRMNPVNEEISANDYIRPRQTSMLELSVPSSENNQRMELNSRPSLGPIAPLRQPARSFSNRLPISPTRDSKRSNFSEDSFDQGSYVQFNNSNDNNVEDRRNSEELPDSDLDRYSTDLSTRPDSSNNSFTFGSRLKEASRSIKTGTADQQPSNVKRLGLRNGKSDSLDYNENSRNQVKPAKLSSVDIVKKSNNISASDQRPRRQHSRSKRNSHTSKHYNESDASMSEDNEISDKPNVQRRNSESDDEKPKHNYDNYVNRDTNMTYNNRKTSNEIRLDDNHQSHSNRNRLARNGSIPDLEHTAPSDSSDLQQQSDLRYSHHEQHQLPSHSTEFTRFFIHSKDVDYV
ncbi:Rho GTPase-activating protein 21 [Trichoplax sp. H2]|nr:Rho GTPase-activating protein 21 [Trichoplax sp. H2]|eukprot:RDD36660.1 Rho GTPase-activating protein 21 [Trichoplax sp. H2]